MFAGAVVEISRLRNFFFVPQDLYCILSHRYQSHYYPSMLQPRGCQEKMHMWERSVPTWWYMPCSKNTERKINQMLFFFFFFFFFFFVLFYLCAMPENDVRQKNCFGQTSVLYPHLWFGKWRAHCDVEQFHVEWLWWTLRPTIYVAV